MADIRVSVPLSELMAILAVVDEYPQLKAEIKSLRRQLEGMHSVYADVLDVVGTLQDELLKSKVKE